MSKKSDLTRRRFLGGALAAGAAAAAASCAKFHIVPRHVLGGPRYVPPSERINIAGIGVGGQGGGDIGAVSEGNNIVALCDVDDERAAGSFKRFPQARVYKDFRVMLDREGDSIDAVTVSTPDHVHAVAAMDAIERGKHVFVQKPLAHSIEEARKLTKAARRAGVATHMGIQAHANQGIRMLREWIEADAIGDVTEIHIWTNRPIWPQGIERPEEVHEVPKTLDWDLWLGPAPWRPYNKIYCPFNWRGWWDFGTGALGDIGCHAMDAPFWALKLGSPISVEAETSKAFKETAPEWSRIIYEFPAREGMPPLTFYWYDGGQMPETPEELKEEGRELPGGGGAQLYVGTKGKILTGDFYCSGPRLIPESRMKEFTPPPEKYPRSIGHYAEWLGAIKGGDPAGANFEFAGPLTEMVLLGNLAVRTGEKVYWDSGKMESTNCPKANRYISDTYRKGYSI